MGKRSDIDKAIRNIMQWAERPEWADAHGDIIDDHLGPVCERMGIALQELGEELVEYHCEATLFGVIFEDMACRSFPPGGRNVIDDYLQRRGWRESVPGRSYLRELRESVLSIYEVVEVSPGRHCDLLDLVRGGKPVRVFEHLGTQSVIKWDRIAARVLILNGKHVFSGGILPFSQAAAQSLLRVLDDSRSRLRKELSKLSGKKVVDEKQSSGEFDEALLRDTSPAFTTIWLMHTLERLRAPLPEMINYDGESLVFTETHFPLLAENLQEIARRLDAGTGWQRDDPDEPSWTWIPPVRKAKKTAQSSSVKPAQPGQHLIYGWLDLKPTVLILHTNSEQRAEQGKKVLDALLHGLVGPALSKLQTPEQMMAEQENRQPGDNRQQGTHDDIDPELAAELVQRYQDDHYRNCLDEPIPMLDGKTPRQCANSKKNRGKVIEWLKYLENGELRRAASQGNKPYDSRWMWDELNLSE